MKTNIYHFIYCLGILIVVVACSTKKNTFVSRNNHALSSKYNILYNGGLALDKGIAELKTQYNDNFWEQLPIERMQISTEVAPGVLPRKNPNFERAEEKAIKSIQKHSMNIDGVEKNPQMDEAHIMLGKARYYDQRFVPALEAFNYILYKYPNSNRIYEAKIWREKTNMRMDNDALAISNLNKLLKEIKFKDQIFADANATLAQAFLNLQQKDSAIAKLKLARDFTKLAEEKSRYYFVLGQLYESLNYADSAYASYQSVIDMKRRAAKPYVMQAHARQASQFDYAKGDTIIFLKKFDDLLLDRENKLYHDVLYHQLALFYDKSKNYKQAKKFYTKSLFKKTSDQYLVASNYRNLATLYFDEAKYALAGKYYDSTLVQLNERTREFRFIKKKRINLDDVIKYEAIANTNDSIIKVFLMSDSDKTAFYENYINKIKKQEEEAKKRQDELDLIAKNNPDANNSSVTEVDYENQKDQKKNQFVDALEQDPSLAKNTVPAKSAVKNNSKTGNFYFYNPSTVAFGKIEFQKQWGKRTYQNNWRNASAKTDKNSRTNDENDLAEDKIEKTAINPKYTVAFYLDQLPKKQTEIDSLAKERNFAYYQLGVIYKEKFKEYNLASSKLEKLLLNNPEERLILPSLYNLYKIYEQTNNPKAAIYKNKIISEYGTSRYAQILSNTNSESNLAIASPELSYDKHYKSYLNGEYRKVYAETTQAIDQFTGEDIIPKYELLKANLAGKLKGLEEYKKSLNFVSLNYPNSDEGKTAEAMLGKEIPQMEALNFYDVAPKSWKILYKAYDSTDVNTNNLYTKINKFITERTIDKLSLSNDIYTLEKNFLVIHNIISEEYAKGILSILKEFKDYKIQDQGYVISNENYKIVQIKKNFEQYLTTPVTNPKPIQEVELPPLRAAEKNNPQEINDDKQSPMPPSLNSDDIIQLETGKFKTNNPRMPSMENDPQIQMTPESKPKK